MSKELGIRNKELGISNFSQGVTQFLIPNSQFLPFDIQYSIASNRYPSLVKCANTFGNVSRIFGQAFSLS